RYVDWNIYGRLERLFVKLFVEEEDLQVNILIDHSQSMGFGEPTKLEYAIKTAAALGYVALAGFDRLSVWSFAEQLNSVMRPLRGRGFVFTLFDGLSKLEANGKTNFTDAIRQFVNIVRRPGMVIIISDFLFRDGIEAGLKALIGRKFEVGLVQVLDRTEVHPDLVGDLKLLDSETRDGKEVTITTAALRAYRRALEHHTSAIRNFCMRHDISYLQVTTNVPFEDFILRRLRQIGLVA
ncbi:MAG TPA: DUF58 domain-containing protein, partial [Armatimonadetes bacterium]|nr:DUF58 domain-containing protein [Armatimonadota bacterium]